jgi:hypothetical protein
VEDNADISCALSAVGRDQQRRQISCLENSDSGSDADAQISTGLRVGSLIPTPGCRGRLEGSQDSPQQGSPICRRGRGGASGLGAAPWKGAGFLLGVFDPLEGGVENNAEGVADVADEVEVAAALQQAEAERDRQIQTEIRSLETEALRRKRQWCTAASLEMQQTSQGVKVEEVEAQRRCRNGTGVVAVLVVAREQLAKQAGKLEGRAQQAAEEKGRLWGELKVYVEGVAAHKARIVDRQEQHLLIISELQIGVGHTLHCLREGAAEAEAELRECEEMGRRGQDELEGEHNAELARLNAQVTTEVSRRQEEVEQLQDCVEGETAKIVRLDRLIARYTGGLGAAEPAVAQVGSDGGSVAGSAL